MNHKITAEALKKYRFFAYFGSHLDEMAELADLVLSNTHNLEGPVRVDISETHWSSASGDWYCVVEEPVAYGKGANFNNLLPFSLKEIAPVSTGVDACVRVKVYKV